MFVETLGEALSLSWRVLVALAATASNDGIANIPGANGNGAFSVASVNVGIAAGITVTADTGAATLPVRRP